MTDLSKRLRELADAMENGPYVSLKTIRDTFREAADAIHVLQRIMIHHCDPTDMPPMDALVVMAAQ